MTTTIIIGNGIGMALNPDYFSLEAGLNSSWEQFNEEEKNIIALENNQCPIGEPELEHQHITATSCKKLLQYQSVNLDFLSEQGKSFPAIYQDFIYKTAKHFCEYEENLPQQFIDRLCNCIELDFPSHIATLNYDKLIYERLIENEFCKGYYGNLVDGIHNKTGNFSPDNLLRTNSTFGWYLHLHGSPLFKSNENKIHKEVLSSVLPEQYNNEDEHSHIVLTHTNYKTDVISGSELLATYFDFFINALSESEKIICLGYSGLDIHINFEIKKWIANKVTDNSDSKRKNKYLIEVVEWKHADNDRAYWESAFFPKFNFEKINISEHIQLVIKPFTNILDYGFDV